MIVKTHESNADEVSFIVFKGFLYPSSNEDYEYLRARACTSYRFPVSVLPVLKKTRLTKAKVKMIPFMEMWRPFMENLETELSKFGDVRIVSAHMAYLTLKTSILPKAEAFLRKVDLFSRRYCIRLSLQTKNREADEMSMMKLNFLYNEEINNSYAFLGKSSEEDHAAELLISSGIKLRLSCGYINNVPTLQVVALDKSGGGWSEVLNRTGVLSKIPKSDLEKASMFLLELC